MGSRLARYAGLIFQAAANRLLSTEKPRRIEGLWIDVGAHLGEYSIGPAKSNPSLLVYAFEPNLSLALRHSGILPNYIVIPMAVSEQDGCAEFFINRDDAASSLLPLDTEGVRRWHGGDRLMVERKVSVPTIRLDTFMRMADIQHVDFLKIDAQGADLSVVKSAGDRIKDIDKITLEVITTPFQLYVGNPTRAETVEYLDRQGFTLIDTDADQSYGQAENLTFIRR